MSTKNQPTTADTKPETTKPEAPITDVSLEELKQVEGGNGRPVISESALGTRTGGGYPHQFR